MNRLTVKTVAQLSGVSEHTLRAWERRYGVVEPVRTGTGRRLYSSEDLERLKFLSALVKNGYSIGMIARLSTEDLRSLLGKLGQSEKPELLISAPRVAAHTAKIIRAVSEFRMDLMDQGLAEARRELGVHCFVLDVASKVLAEVGIRSLVGDWTIVQEHAFSVIMRDHLMQILRSLSPSFPSGEEKGSFEKQVILAAPEGDLHEFGILIAAILLASRSFHVFFLGPNVPAREVGYACERFHAGIALLGTIPQGKKSSNDYFMELDRILPEGVQLWIGGPGFDPHGTLPQSSRWLHLVSLQDLDHLIRSKV